MKTKHALHTGAGEMKKSRGLVSLAYSNGYKFYSYRSIPIH